MWQPGVSRTGAWEKNRFFSSAGDAFVSSAWAAASPASSLPPVARGLVSAEHVYLCRWKVGEQ